MSRSHDIAHKIGQLTKDKWRCGKSRNRRGRAKVIFEAEKDAKTLVRLMHELHVEEKFAVYPCKDHFHVGGTGFRRHDVPKPTRTRVRRRNGTQIIGGRS